VGEVAVAVEEAPDVSDTVLPTGWLVLLQAVGTVVGPHS